MPLEVENKHPYQFFSTTFNRKLEVLPVTYGKYGSFTIRNAEQPERDTWEYSTDIWVLEYVTMRLLEELRIRICEHDASLPQDAHIIREILQDYECHGLIDWHD